MFSIINPNSSDLKLIVSGLVTAVLFSGLMLCIDLSGSFSAACHFHPDLVNTLLWGNAISYLFFMRFCIHKTSQSVKAKRERRNVQRITNKFFPAGDIPPIYPHHGFALLPSPLKKIVFDFYCTDYLELLYCYEEFGLSKIEMTQFLNQIRSYFGFSQTEIVEGIKCLEKISHKVPSKIVPSRKRNTDPLNHILYEWKKLSLDQKYQLFCWIAYNQHKWHPKNLKADDLEIRCLAVAIMLLLPFKRADETSPFFKESLISHFYFIGSPEESALSSHMSRGILERFSACSILFFRYLPKEKIPFYETFFNREEYVIELFRRKMISPQKFYKHVCILGWNSTLSTILKADPLIVKEIVTFKDHLQKKTLLSFAILAAKMAKGMLKEALHHQYIHKELLNYYHYIAIIRKANHVETIKLLLEAGSDPHDETDGMISPKSLAMNLGLLNIVDILDNKPLSGQKKDNPKKSVTVSKNNSSNANCFSIIRPLSIQEVSIPTLV